MATHITVAVGANGEALAAKGMRDGARADRLDTEATTKQARKAAIEKLDDDTNGRENKLGKYGPSRDPAAFARKKKDGYGDFVGVNIFYEYFPLVNQWEVYFDHAFLKLSVRGCVVEDGSASLAPPIEIELTRNIWTETFALPIPDGMNTKTLNGILTTGVPGVAFKVGLGCLLACQIIGTFLAITTGKSDLINMRSKLLVSMKRATHFG